MQLAVERSYIDHPHWFDLTNHDGRRRLGEDQFSYARHPVDDLGRRFASVSVASSDIISQIIEHHVGAPHVDFFPLDSDVGVFQTIGNNDFDIS